MQLKLSNTSTLAFATNQNRIALAVKFAAVATAIIVLYFQDLSIVFANTLTDESTTHVLVVPFLLAYLLYRKRRMVNAAIQSSKTNAKSFMRFFSTIAGSLLCATAILIYWFGSYTFTPLEYHMATLPFFAAGLILIVFNMQTLKQLIFPVFFLIFLMPPPAEILYGVGSLLSNLSAEAANALANVFGLHSTLSANYGSPIIILIRPDQTQMNFSVDVACSGVYSLIGFTIFAAFIAYITRGKLRNKLAVFLLGIPLILALNIIRITAILGIGYSYGDELALQVFHTIGATVLMFIGTLILLAITEKVFKKPPPPKPCTTCAADSQPKALGEFCPSCGKIQKFARARLSKSDIAKIASIAIVVVLLMSIQAPVFALTEGPAQVIIQTPSGGEEGTTQILPQVQGYELRFLYRDKEFEQLSGEDKALAYLYTLNETEQSVYVSVEVAQSLSSLHRWETCLINYPLSHGLEANAKQLDLHDIQIQENPPVLARYFAFEDHWTGQTQIVLYWYETATFNINGTSQQKHIKMSVILYPQSEQEISEAENQLVVIASAINDYWQPIKAWTAFALVMSQNGMLLSAATITLFAVLVLYKVFLDWHQKGVFLRLYEKLSEADQLVVKAVSNAAAAGGSATSNVTKEYEKLSKTPFTEMWLVEKLHALENAGLVKKTLKNRNDVPALNWASCMNTKPSILKKLNF